MYPQQWGFRSSSHFCLIFGSGWPLVRWTPQERYLVAKCVTTSVRLTSGQTYLPETTCGQVFYCGQMSGWPLVRCNPPAETSCGQVWHYYIFVSSWTSVRCTPTPHGQRYLVAKCDTTSGQIDLLVKEQVWCQQLVWSVETTSTHERPFIREGNYLVSIVRLIYIRNHIKKAGWHNPNKSAALTKMWY